MVCQQYKAHIWLRIDAGTHIFTDEEPCQGFVPEQNWRLIVCIHDGMYSGVWSGFRMRC